MSGSTSVTRGKLEFNGGKRKNADGTSINRSEDFLRDLFESGTGDWDMVSSDGLAYNFHKCVVSEQSWYFRKLFANPGSKECVQKEIIVPPEVDMNGPAVEAFLRHIYYLDKVPMFSSFGITCALIRAGYYYTIPAIIQHINDIFYSKGIQDGPQKSLDWFNFPDLCKLYQQVSLWDRFHTFKNSLLGTIMAIIQEFGKTCVLSDLLMLVPRAEHENLFKDLDNIQVVSSSLYVPSYYKLELHDQFWNSKTLLSRMYDNQGGDWELVSSNGKIYKFHEIILSRRVPCFQRVFVNPGTMECVNKRVFFPPELEIIGPDTDAFLRYIYYHNTSFMETSFRATCAQIRAGYYFDLQEIMVAANEVMTSRLAILSGLNWFSYEELWELYQQVAELEESHPFRIKLLSDTIAIMKRFYMDEVKATTASWDVLKYLVFELIEDRPSPSFLNV